MADIPLTAPIVPNPGSQAQSAYAKYVSDGWINVADHAARDALHTGVTTVGTLVRTLNDGVVWEVVSVGPVVYAPWSGAGGVTSFATRTGAVVPLSNDYAASQITNDSSVTGSFVKGALNTLLALIGTGTAPFKATFYVDPTFSGTSTGSQSTPFPSYTTAIAAAVSAGLSAARFVQAPGTNSTETVTLPTSGNWELASDYTGSQRGVATVTTKITGDVVCSTGGLVLTNLAVTGNISGNAVDTVSGNSLTLKNTILSGAITLTATGAAFWQIFCEGDSAFPNGNVGCVVSGAVSVVGGIVAKSSYFGSTLALISVNRFVDCRLNGNITLSGTGGAVPALTLLNCTWPNSPLTITGTGTTPVVMDGYTASSKFTLSGCVLNLRNNVTPLRATFYVDPLFVTPAEALVASSGSTGTPSNPFTSITAAIASAPSTGALIILAPFSNTTENVVFPTTGIWEVRCDNLYRATITGNVTCTSVAQCQYALTNMVVTGNVSGDATSSSGNFLHLTNTQVLSNVALTRTGSGAWFAIFRGTGSTFFSFSGSVQGTTSVAGQLLMSRYSLGGAVSIGSIGSEAFGCRFGSPTFNLGILGVAGSITFTSSIMTSPVFTGPGTVDMDGYTWSRAGSFTTAGGAVVTLRSAVDPSGITQGGASGVNVQALMWNGSAWAATTVVSAVTTVFGRAGAVVAAVGDYAASKITNDSATVSGAHVSDALDSLKALIAASVTGVSSVYGRTGAVIATAGDYAASKINNDSATVTGTHVSDALDALKALISSSGVTSWKTRTGAVVPLSNDYAASQITNDSTVIGTGVSGAINTLKAQIAALVASSIGNDSSVTGTTVKDALNSLRSQVLALVTGVSSFKTRTGAVVPAAGDYDAVQVTDTGSSIGSPTRTVRDSIDILNGKTSSQIVNASGLPGTSISDALVIINNKTSSDINNASSVSGTSISDALNNIQTEIFGLDSDIANVSTVTGATVTDALDNLKSDAYAGDFSIALVSLDGNGWTFATPNGWAANGGGDVHMNPIGPIPANRSLTKVKVRISPVGGHGALPANMPTLAVYAVNGFGIGHLLGSSPVTDSSGSVAAYELPHDITVSTGTTFTGSNESFYFVLTSEDGTNSLSGCSLVSATMTLAA